MLQKEIQATFLPFKNLAASLLFSVFLGPIGLLYSTSRGGIIMSLIAFVVLSSRLPVPIMLMWVSCCIWSVIATNRYNNKLMEVRIRNQTNEEKNYSPQASH
jgi:hypothetical protein